MHDAAIVAEVRRLYYGEHWKLGTIAAQLQLHPDAVRRAVNRPMGKPAPRPPRPRALDPFQAWLKETLQTYPRLPATVLYRMLRERGYQGGVVQVRRLVRKLRPPRQGEAFLRLLCLPGEAGQVDWADFGCVQVGRAKRRLSAFVMTLSYSRALYAELFFDQTLGNFLTGHQRAFEAFGGVPRQLLCDNLRSAVLERRGELIRFHPRYLELAGHYCFQSRPCNVRRGNEKGRVERSIRYLKEAFWPTQSFTTLADCNARLGRWIAEVAHARPWPDDQALCVAEVFAREQPRLLALPAHRLDTTESRSVHSKKILWVRFDRNDYSVPPQAVGRDLTLRATDTEVRLFDGATEIARHRRCYDQGQRITIPAHAEALLDSKRAAFATASSSALHTALPELELFLQAAFPNARSTSGVLTRLKRLLALYGEGPLNRALQEARQRGTATLSSVEFLLEKNRRATNRPTPLPVDLADRPDLEGLYVKTHALSAYDRLAEPQPEQEEHKPQQQPVPPEEPHEPEQ
jgi:transposase